MKKNSIKKSTSGWGGFPSQMANIMYPTDINQILTEIKRSDVIARGNGRAYGDSAINKKIQSV